MILTTFLTNNYVPALGLTPTIRIRHVDETTNTLVVTDDTMLEVGDGFYKYVFTGYDPTLSYVYRVDAGVGVTIGERYKYGATEEVKLESSQNEGIAGAVWEELKTDHMDPSTMGGALVFTKADTANIVITQSTINTLINTMLKYQRNRTRIDATAKTLTVFDDDCTSVLQVFDLKDSAGQPSVVEVCERRPQGC